MKGGAAFAEGREVYSSTSNAKHRSIKTTMRHCASLRTTALPAVFPVLGSHWQHPREQQADNFFWGVASASC